MVVVVAAPALELDLFRTRDPCSLDLGDSPFEVGGGAALFPPWRGFFILVVDLMALFGLLELEVAAGDDRFRLLSLQLPEVDNAPSDSCKLLTPRSRDC